MYSPKYRHCLNETKLDTSVPCEDISLLGFSSPIRKDRNRHGGGVAIYIKEQLHAKTRTDRSNRDVESIWIQLNI